MAWEWIKVCTFLSLCATSVVVSDKEEREKCEDFNNIKLENKPTNSIQIQYLLLTQKNSDCASLFNQQYLKHTEKHTAHFNATLPTKVIVHGYRALGSKPSWVMGLAQALLQKEDVNVFIVDWVCTESFAYNLVVKKYKEVALQITIFIHQLKINGSSLESFHLIGISLGAHVAGFVGTLFDGKLGRITGLDPAGPMFKNAVLFDRLDPSDAMFVEAIHTDSDNFGISIPVGHVDFFLNGGMDQPGCARSDLTSMYGYVICDHMRAVHVYISALNGTCALTGLPCSSYEDFKSGQCTSCDGPFNSSCPQIGLLKNGGITVSPRPIREKVFLMTTSEAPFCIHHILVELNVTQLEKSAEVQVSLISMQGTKTEKKLRLQTDKIIYKKVLGHSGGLCKTSSIQLKNTGTRFYRQGNIHFKTICISEFPEMRGMKPLCVENIRIGRSTPWSHDFVQAC